MGSWSKKISTNFLSCLQKIGIKHMMHNTRCGCAFQPYFLSDKWIQDFVCWMLHILKWFKVHWRLKISKEPAHSFSNILHQSPCLWIEVPNWTWSPNRDLTMFVQAHGIHGLGLWMPGDMSNIPFHLSGVCLVLLGRYCSNYDSSCMVPLKF